MNRVNLIPLHRQLHDGRRTRLRTWSLLGAAISGALVLICGIWFASPSQVSPPSPEDFSRAAGDLAKANQEAAALRKQVAGLREQVQSRQFVLEQPDYSLLLSMISQIVDDSVVLNQCELSSGNTRSEQASEPVLKIGGYARSQPAVAGFMLQLETTGIFKRVTLVRSEAQPVMDLKAAAFQVECLLGPPSREAP